MQQSTRPVSGRQSTIAGGLARSGAAALTAAAAGQPTRQSHRDSEELLVAALPWRLSLAPRRKPRAELHDIAVLHDVVLAFHADLASSLRSSHGTGLDQVVV